MTAKEMIISVFRSDIECDTCFLGGLDICDTPCSRCLIFGIATKQFITGCNPLI